MTVRDCTAVYENQIIKFLMSLMIKQCENIDNVQPVNFLMEL